MTDDADRAAQIVMDAEERALATRLVRMRTLGCATSSCTVCGDPIPVARRQAVEGCRTCVECQDALEQAR